MPFAKNTDLPESVRGSLPYHAQEIYREAFNCALEQYDEEVTAHKVAWSAVKHKYHKNKAGDWVEGEKK